jgi:hypothetical protein
MSYRVKKRRIIITMPLSGLVLAENDLRIICFFCDIQDGEEYKKYAPI